jgi:aspartyl-tRNA(Asn)/glutamyl-tRNA(Gln) amidotransferase subunit B
MTSSPGFEPVIGLEVHAELLTNSKMFCGCAVVDSTQAEPNTSVCEICTGMPGTLPVINARAVEFALRVALALNCEIRAESRFARKNYFYPDLPKGYQISQFELPLAVGGWLAIPDEGKGRRIRIRRVHLEEDTGKLFHQDRHSLVDYNRSGVPLLEIVSEPELHSVDQARAFATALRSLLRYLEVNSGDMEKGVIRFEANISVRPVGSTTLGTRTEIKNLNSLRAMTQALEHEIERQSQKLARGEEVAQETVGWDEIQGVTVPQRGKEEAHDYRYFPEPDLPPLRLDSAMIDQIRAALPELPHDKRARFIDRYRLSPYSAGVLTAERPVADYFEASAAQDPNLPPEKIAHWISGAFFSHLNQAGIEIDASPVPPENLAVLVSMVEAGEINATSGKAVLAEMFTSGGDPRTIVEAGEYRMLNDEDALISLVSETLRDNPQQVDDFLDGKVALFQWLFGQAMRAAGGVANPATLKRILETALREREESRQRDG